MDELIALQVGHDESVFDIIVSRHSFLQLCKKSTFVSQTYELCESDAPIRIFMPSPYSVTLFQSAIVFAGTGELPSNAYTCAMLVKLADFLDYDELGNAALQFGNPSMLTNDDGSICENADDVSETAFACDTCNAFVTRRCLLTKRFVVRHNVVVCNESQSRPKDRAGAPLFLYPNLLCCAVRNALPEEVHACVECGLIVCGGFIARIAAHLAQISREGTNAKCDIDLFAVGNKTDTLRVVRRALLCLGNVCKIKMNGMFVVRSAYALTIGMDNCPFNIQIVLCAFGSVAEIFESFDIDACKFAYDGERVLCNAASIHSIASGVVVADPKNDSVVFAKRLVKYGKIGFALHAKSPCSESLTLTRVNTELSTTSDDGEVAMNHEYWSQRHVACEWDRVNCFWDTSPGRAFHATSGPEWHDRTAAQLQVPHANVYVTRVAQMDLHDYSGGYPHTIVDVWRNQRRRDSGHHTWRLASARRVALAIGDAPRASNVIPNVVYQQFDAHPFFGSWNKIQIQYHQLDDESHALKCLDFIEDASLVHGNETMSKLPRFMSMRYPNEWPYQKKAYGQWITHEF